MSKLTNIAGRFKTLAQADAEILEAVAKAVQASASNCIPVADAASAVEIGERITGALLDALDWGEDSLLQYRTEQITVRGKPMSAMLLCHLESDARFILHLHDEATGEWFVPSTTWAAAKHPTTGRISINAMLTMPAHACKHFGVAFVEPNSELPK